MGIPILQNKTTVTPRPHPNNVTKFYLLSYIFLTGCPCVYTITLYKNLNVITNISVFIEYKFVMKLLHNSSSETRTCCYCDYFTIHSISVTWKLSHPILTSCFLFCSILCCFSYMPSIFFGN